MTERPELDAAEWDALRARQLEWEAANPVPKHTPDQVCDCPTPWRQARGIGHCASRGGIATGAEIARRKAAKAAGISVYQIPQEWVWYATINGARMPGEFPTAEVARDAAMVIAGIAEESL